MGYVLVIEATGLASYTVRWTKPRMDPFTSEMLHVETQLLVIRGLRYERAGTHYIVSGRDAPMQPKRT